MAAEGRSGDRLARAWRAVGCLSCGLLVLTAVCLVVGLGLSLGYEQGSSFVTGRPDLSAPLDALQANRVRHKIGHYCTSVGLSPDDARGLQFALSSEGLVARFNLGPTQLTRFLSHKRRLPETPTALVHSANWERWFRVEAPGHGGGSSRSLPELYQYPFTRLSWWPLRERDVVGMEAYEGTMTWSSGDAHPGTAYYVLVSRVTGQVYVVGY
jgi:hypothetical protein